MLFWTRIIQKCERVRLTFNKSGIMWHIVFSLPLPVSFPCCSFKFPNSSVNYTMTIVKKEKVGLPHCISVTSSVRRDNNVKHLIQQLACYYLEESSACLDDNWRCDNGHCQPKTVCGVGEENRWQNPGGTEEKKTKKMSQRDRRKPRRMLWKLG